MPPPLALRYYRPTNWEFITIKQRLIITIKPKTRLNLPLKYRSLSFQATPTSLKKGPITLLCMMLKSGLQESLYLDLRQISLDPIHHLDKYGLIPSRDKYILISHGQKISYYTTLYRPVLNPLVLEC